MDLEDPLTTLNTQLNRSMVLMETTTEILSEPRSKKTIRINTNIHPSNSPNSPYGMKRKGILKKSTQSPNHELGFNRNFQMDTSIDERSITTTEIGPRPSNIEEFVEVNELRANTTKSTFSLNELSSDEEIWIMDIPKTVDPRELKGQTLTLGTRSKLKIGEEKYCAHSHEIKSHFTCVFNSGKSKKFKTVNIKPVGSMTVRRKLPNTPEIEPLYTENTRVPFPDHLKTRHPLFGVISNTKIKEEKKT